MNSTISGFGRMLYLIAGWLFVGIGVAGALLPVLPTTPFLLLASYCFVRSSPQAHQWLRQHRWFGPMLCDWEDHRALRPAVKWWAVGTVVVVMAMAVLFGEGRELIRNVTLLLCAVGLTVVLRLPTRRAMTTAPPAESDAA